MNGYDEPKIDDFGNGGKSYYIASGQTEYWVRAHRTATDNEGTRDISFSAGVFKNGKVTGTLNGGVISLPDADGVLILEGGDADKKGLATFDKSFEDLIDA